MFCSKCGNTIDDSALVCPNCGCPTSNYENQNQNNQSQYESSNIIVSEYSTLENRAKIFAIISIAISIFTLLFGIITVFIGLICGIAGLIICIKLSKKNNTNISAVQKAKKLNTIGILLNIIFYVLSVFLSVFFFQ